MRVSAVASSTMRACRAVSAVVNFAAMTPAAVAATANVPADDRHPDQRARNHPGDELFRVGGR